jgi:hypothetical protein
MLFLRFISTACLIQICLLYTQLVLNSEKFRVYCILHGWNAWCIYSNKYLQSVCHFYQIVEKYANRIWIWRTFQSPDDMRGLHQAQLCQIFHLKSLKRTSQRSSQHVQLQFISIKHQYACTGSVGAEIKLCHSVLIILDTVAARDKKVEAAMQVWNMYLMLTRQRQVKDWRWYYTPPLAYKRKDDWRIYLHLIQWYHTDKIAP